MASDGDDDEPGRDSTALQGSTEVTLEYEPALFFEHKGPVKLNFCRRPHGHFSCQTRELPP